jgi:hypothetical protein
MTKLLDTEKELLTALAEAYNLYCTLPDRFARDDEEVTHLMNQLQARIAMRIARRVEPNFWTQQ